ncbi:hypothetical protein QFC22_002241 [Naganishia vaughanmartiniae]|uniref:Uncharacterized protein n=1 Tax=Naganishia vaughanmartiniae TaxID=1424756 RepID=A0ACC2XE12_9TREE|nr:hypothetical protein QFC22_002241 [Naganishia vaughanmartiniae]
MPGRRSRSPSPDRHHRRSKRRDDYNDDDDDHKVKETKTVESLESVGAKEISDEDYFLKAAEFRLWLREEKRKYIDEMTGDSARKYFKKFVKRWNGCTLPAQYYKPQASTAQPSSSQTAYKWSFATNRSKVNKDELARMREDVDRLTNSSSRGSGTSAPARPTVGPSLPPGARGRDVGPAFPSTMFSANHTDRQLALENKAENATRDRKHERKAAYERADDMVPRAGGREGKLEERRAANEENKKYRERDAASGFEVDENTLMGTGSSFGNAVAQREQMNARRQERRSNADADKRSMMSESMHAMKSKEDATMAMFKQMAQSRFGGQ